MTTVRVTVPRGNHSSNHGCDMFLDNRRPMAKFGPSARLAASSALRRHCMHTAAAVVEVGLLLGLCLSLLSCGSVVSESEARQRIDAYYQELAAGRTPLEFYSRRFYEVTPREEWVGALNRLGLDLGRPVDWSVQLVGGEQVVGADTGAGSFLVFECNVTYEKGITRELIAVTMEDAESRLSFLRHHIGDP